MFDVPPGEHGVVFMLRVMAMLHITSGELAESKGDLHAASAIGHPANSVHVFPGPFFPFWRSFSTAAENQAFFEVNMNRMAPAISTIFKVPNFQLTLTWCGTQSPCICRQACAAIGLHRPWCAIGSGASSKCEGAVDRIVNFLLSRLSQWDHLLATDHIIRRIHAEVFAIIARYAELKEFADTGISTDPPIATIIDRAVLSRHDFFERNRTLWPSAPLVLQQVHKIKDISFSEITEIHDDVITLGNRLRRQDTHFGTQRAVESNCVLHDISVIADHVERHRRTVLLDQSNLHVTRHRPIEDSEAILSRSHIHVRLVLPVGEDPVTHETIQVEGIEPELSFFIPSFVSQDQIDIVVAVTPVHRCTTGQSEIDSIFKAFITAIQ